MRLSGFELAAASSCESKFYSDSSFLGSVPLEPLERKHMITYERDVILIRVGIKWCEVHEKSITHNSTITLIYR